MAIIKSTDYIRPDENINIFKYISDKPESEHSHEFIEIVYTLRGKCAHCVGGSRYSVERGDLLFINFGQTHSFEPQGEMELVNILVNPTFIGTELIGLDNALEIMALSAFAEFGSAVGKLVPFVRFRGQALLHLEQQIGVMNSEFSCKDTNYRTALRGHLLVLLTLVFRQMRQTTDTLAQLNRIAPDILQYIELNCFEKISLGELSRKCFYNPSYFSRIFRECYGMSFMEYIHEKRVMEATRLLVETDRSIENICRSVGYEDKKQFYRTFRQLTGMTPGKMRGNTKK